MKKIVRDHIIFFCIVLMAGVSIFSFPVQADTGPKPSVVVEFEGIEEETYYVTLLSETESTGPWSADSGYEDWYEDREAWEKFDAYSDVDGFYFLGCYQECSETDEFIWGYYPPETFKILLYFPEQNSFIVSDIYERYAFDSYYTMEISKDAVATVTTKVEKSYDYTGEVISLICRIIITVLLELGIAWLFGFRKKKQILVIGVTNVVTQTGLNLLLNLIHYNSGSFALVFHYIWLEVLVFVIEGVVYAVFLKRLLTESQKKLHPWLYALAANVVSFLVGLMIAEVVPGIF